MISCQREEVEVVAQKWLLPTLSEVLARTDAVNSGRDGADIFVPEPEQVLVTENSHRHTNNRTASHQAKAEQQWCGAISALEQLLLHSIDIAKLERGRSPKQGLLLAGPVPVFSHPALLASLETKIFTADAYNGLALMPLQLPPADQTHQKLPEPHCPHSLPLIPADPLATEQFCVVFTAKFSLVMAIGEDLNGVPAFLFSFEPEVVEQAWAALRSRLTLTSPQSPSHLDQLVERFPPTAPDYRLVMQFSRLLLKYLPDDSREYEEPKRCSGKALYLSENQEKLKNSPNSKSKIQNPKSNDDVELLQALTHEIRTPLTTIRTLTKLLLKRRDIAPDIIKRLEIIENECTEQINRMELIFRAVEFETSEVKESQMPLTAMSLEQIFQQSIPLWQKQASRRNLTLDVLLPQKLPNVVSNPAMLDQMLTGLIENFTRSMPSGSHIQVEVTPAGHQLKLQLQSHTPVDEENLTGANYCQSNRKSIGQMLIFQPETGNLSLNLNVTKNLFQAIGGKLIVRQRPQQGEVMTIFLPLH